MVWTSHLYRRPNTSTTTILLGYGHVEAGGISLRLLRLFPYLTNINPIPRFAMLGAINATTGAIMWTLNGGIFPAAIADGYLVGCSGIRRNVLLPWQRSNFNSSFSTNHSHAPRHHSADTRQRSGSVSSAAWHSSRI